MTNIIDTIFLLNTVNFPLIKLFNRVIKIRKFNLVDEFKNIEKIQVLQGFSNFSASEGSKNVKLINSFCKVESLRNVRRFMHLCNELLMIFGEYSLSALIVFKKIYSEIYSFLRKYIICK